MAPRVYRGYYDVVSMLYRTQIAQAKLLWSLKCLKATVGRLFLGVEPSYESISQTGTPLYNGQKACSQCLRCSEAPLYLSFVWISTQAFGAGRITERGRPGAGKKRVGTVRDNERVCYLVQVSDVGLKRR